MGCFVTPAIEGEKLGQIFGDYDFYFYENKYYIVYSIWKVLFVFDDTFESLLKDDPIPMQIVCSLDNIQLTPMQGYDLIRSFVENVKQTENWAEWTVRRCIELKQDRRT